MTAEPVKLGDVADMLSGFAFKSAEFLLIRPQEVSTCRVFNLGITEEAFYALR